MSNMLLSSVLVKEAYRYIEKDPMKNFPKLLDWAEKVTTQKNYRNTIQTMRKVADDPENNWNQYIRRVFDEIDKNVIKKMLINFFINAGIVGTSVIDKNREKYGCNIPWAILFDPTTACNLKCIGCWAAEYGGRTSLDYATMDGIVKQGRKLGIYMYVLSGGEPLVRKDEILRLARDNDDCVFLSFTNGTLIDEDFAEKVAEAGNLGFAISVEGLGNATDMRRGAGTYEKVMKAMDILKRHGVAYGFSACYHSKNTDSVGSDEFVDLMIEKGCMFGWYFTYIPIGKDAVPELLATPEQREFMYRQVRRFRETKPIFLLDFWNDGEYVKGCIAGGRNYLHINANGDVEPCAFIHYSNVNIKDVSLLEALQSPIFQQYRKYQPFNENHLRPCPMLDNPEFLRKMVRDSGAHSTQLGDNESADELTAKTEPAAEKWAVTADRLWRAHCSSK